MTNNVRSNKELKEWEAKKRKYRDRETDIQVLSRRNIH